MRKLIATLVGVAVCGVVVAAQTPSGNATNGKALYAEKKCGTCHKTNKADATGGKMSTVLADSVAKMSAADIKSWFTDAAKMEAKLAKKPTATMSGYLKGLKPALTDGQIADLVAYMMTLK
jgi:mono/diheme cytochrome c family protein